MGVISFYERRKNFMAINFVDRRRVARRSTALHSTAVERRRLASQVRQHERDHFTIQARLLIDKNEVSGCTCDINPSGLKIIADAALNVGTPLALQFSFGTDFCYMNIAGHVAYCVRVGNGKSGRYTIGIKFSALHEFDKKILNSVVQDLKNEGATHPKSFLAVSVTTDSLAKEAGKLFITSSILKQKGHANGNPSIASVDPLATIDQKSTAAKRGRKFTPDPSWVIEMRQQLEPYRDAILQCRLVQETSTGELSLPQIKGWNIQFYPFIESFPQFMALNLAKEQDSMSRLFLIDNIRIEKRHADAWIDMANGFGVTKERMLSSPILPEVEALTHWLWSINARGSLAEGIAATNYAIEGVTQGIATIMVRGFDKYRGEEGINLDRKAYWWMEAHAKYDDLHPYEALEIVKRHATSHEMQLRVKHAAQRSMEYLFIALEACYLAYAHADLVYKT